MEEDIKKLERFIKDYRICERNCKGFTSNVTSISREEYQSLENLIKGYKELKGQYEKLEEDYYILEGNSIDLEELKDRQIKSYEEALTRYIPKARIRKILKDIVYELDTLINEMEN